MHKDTQQKESHVGARIRRVRQDRALSIDDLSRALADMRKPVDPKTIERIENGKTQPRGETLRRIAEALGISVEYLNANEPVVPPPQTDEQEDLGKWIEAQSRMVRVPLVRATRPGDLSGAFPAFGIVTLKPEDLTEEQEDVVAEVFQALTDLVNLWSDFGPFKQRELLKVGFESVMQLEGLGLVLGTGRHSMTAVGRGMDWDKQAQIAVFKVERVSSYTGEWWVPANQGFAVG